MSQTHLDWFTSTSVLAPVAIFILTFALFHFHLLPRTPKPYAFHFDFPPLPLAPEILPSPSIGHSPREIISFNPSTFALLGSSPALSASEISAAIVRARQAAGTWSRTSHAQRAGVLRSFLAFFLAHLTDFERLSMQDTGKTNPDAVFGEILTTLEKGNWLLRNSEGVLSPQKRGTNFLLAAKRSEVRYEPRGVCVACVSWNYPIHNLLSPVFAAVMSGNSIIVKPSELVCWSSTIVADSFRACLKAGGFDPNVVQVSVCLPAAVEALTSSPDIDHLTFIGSEPVGKLVAAACAPRLTPTCIELGGKDAAVILPGSDMKQVEEILLRACFQAAGQNCIGIERIICHQSLYNDLVQRMESRVAQLQIKRDVGAMINGARFAELERVIQAAVKQGARCLVGGKRSSIEVGYYFQPTLMVDVTPEMELAQQEMFAPIMTIMKVESTEHAIQVANGTRYGLGAAVFGGNERECESVVSQLRCGMVSVNDFAVTYLNQGLPFGGVGASGHGRFGGPEGLRSLCTEKSVTKDRLFTTLKTNIPSRLRYPILDSERSTKFLHGLMHMAYATGLIERVRGLYQLFKSS